MKTTEEIQQEEIVRKIKSTFKTGDTVFILAATWMTPINWVRIDEINFVTKTVVVKEITDHEIKVVTGIPFDIFLQTASFTEYTREPVGFSQDRPKPKKKNGDPFEVGDEVWTFDRRGAIKGVVAAIDTSEINYKVRVDKDNEDEERYTTDGRYTVGGEPVLFHQEPVVTFKD